MFVNHSCYLAHLGRGGYFVFKWPALACICICLCLHVFFLVFLVRCAFIIINPIAIFFKKKKKMCTQSQNASKHFFCLSLVSLVLSIPLKRLSRRITIPWEILLLVPGLFIPSSSQKLGWAELMWSTRFDQPLAFVLKFPHRHFHFLIILSSVSVPMPWKEARQIFSVERAVILVNIRISKRFKLQNRAVQWTLLTLLGYCLTFWTHCALLVSLRSDIFLKVLMLYYLRCKRKVVNEN